MTGEKKMIDKLIVILIIAVGMGGAFYLGIFIGKVEGYSECINDTTKRSLENIKKNNKEIIEKLYSLKSKRREENE